MNNDNWYDISYPSEPLWRENEGSADAPGRETEGRLEPIQQEAVCKDVLVVDDDPHLCDIMTSVLEGEGHTTRSAANGREALKLISERKPQLILLDLMMPVMNGWELAAELRANPQWADIPVVLVTAAHGSAGAKQSETGARAVITKPFDIDVLAQVVEMHAA